MVAATADGAFDEVGVGVGYTGVVAIARENANAIEVGGGDFLVLLFEGVEGFTCAFDMVWCQRGTVASKSKNGGTEIRRAVDDMFLAGFIYISEEEIIKSGADDGVGVGY
jgi:hypothetical protein